MQQDDGSQLVTAGAAEGLTGLLRCTANRTIADGRCRGLICMTGTVGGGIGSITGGCTERCALCRSLGIGVCFH